MQRLRHLTGIAVALAATLVVTPSAQAQFGGLINKAKDKVAQQAGEKVGPVAPGEQLSDDVLAKVIAGATASDQVLAERDRLLATITDKEKQLSEMRSKNEPVHAAWN